MVAIEIPFVGIRLCTYARYGMIEGMDCILYVLNNLSDDIGQEPYL